MFMAIDINSTDKNTIKLLRFPLALLVIYIHVDLISTNQFPFITSETTPLLWNINYFISKILGNCCVPTFFLISGLLLFKNGNNSSKDWIVKFRKRVNTLFVPYMLWNVVFLICIAVFQYKLPGLFQHTKLVKDYNALDFIFCFVSMDFVNNGVSFRPFLIGPIDLPLWYLRDLMILIFLAPFIQYLLNRFKRYFLYAIIAIWISGVIKHLLFIDFIGFPFFILGAYLGINGIGFSVIFNKSKYLIFSFLFLTGMQMFLKMDTPTWLISLNTLIGVCTIIFVFGKLCSLNIKSPVLLMKSTFFIYASHYLLSIFAIRFIVGVMPQNEFLFILLYLLVPILVVTTLVCVYGILPPPYEKYLQVDVKHKSAFIIRYSSYE